MNGRLKKKGAQPDQQQQSHVEQIDEICTVVEQDKTRDDFDGHNRNGDIARDEVFPFVGWKFIEVNFVEEGKVNHLHKPTQASHVGGGEEVSDKDGF